MEGSAVRSIFAHRSNFYKNIASRTTLIALCAALILSIVELGISTALAVSNDNKKFDTNYKLDPQVR